MLKLGMLKISTEDKIFDIFFYHIIKACRIRIFRKFNAIKVVISPEIKNIYKNDKTDNYVAC
ncbi:hypothetical protein BpHYR1_049813 [Brachionus plicatilis]|uniref:Uncharacterized protein n=1 Tax=Brachionus plicatilis TaxID=10195 RepID=A0A3M7RL04_BRAPC|nr:hypothetical protein BpHYR1_049813 [Brachionus plicatilis]